MLDMACFNLDRRKRDDDFFDKDLPTPHASRKKSRRHSSKKKTLVFMIDTTPIPNIGKFHPSPEKASSPKEEDPIRNMLNPGRKHRKKLKDMSLLKILEEKTLFTY